MKKDIRLHYTDVNLDSISPVLDWLEEIYDVQLTSDGPDFILHSCFGREHLLYEGVRVAWLGENLQPDFNVSDYGMGFSRLNFGDRYMRVPLYRWYLNDYERLFDEQRRVRKVDGKLELSLKRRFATMVVSNSSRGDYFDAFHHAISREWKVCSGGRFENNVGGPVDDKLAFIGEGKFHLAFENTSSPGYITEKLLHAFVAKTVPIYWGAPDVAIDFNSKAMINCHEFDSVEDVLSEIRRLDQDDEAYARMLQEPCFNGGIEPSWLEKRQIVTWLQDIFSQPRASAYRRNSYYWGERYQEEMVDAFFKPHVQVAKLMKKMVRRIFEVR